MASYALPLERRNDKIPKEYCYIIIVNYPDNYWKPENGKKRLSAEQTKEKEKALKNNKETIERLDSGYFNSFNYSIKLETILNSSFASYLENDEATIYRINPKTCKEISGSYGYGRFDYEVSEFDVIKKLTTKEEILEQFYKDNLIIDFSATYLKSFSYANEGYAQKVQDYFKYIKSTFKDVVISLSDLLFREKYNEIYRDITKNMQDNIRYLLDNEMIVYFKENDYYRSELVTGLIKFELSDIALKCIKLDGFLGDYYKKDLLKKKAFNDVIKENSTDTYVKEIIKELNLNLVGVTLIVKQYMDYGDDRIVEEKVFDNIGQLKTYLIKQYELSFDEVMNSKISELSTEEYYFKVVL